MAAPKVPAPVEANSVMLSREVRGEQVAAPVEGQADRLVQAAVGEGRARPEGARARRGELRDAVAAAFAANRSPRPSKARPSGPFRLGAVSVVGVVEKVPGPVPAKRLMVLAVLVGHEQVLGLGAGGRGSQSEGGQGRQPQERGGFARDLHRCGFFLQRGQAEPSPAALIRRELGGGTKPERSRR